MPLQWLKEADDLQYRSNNGQYRSNQEWKRVALQGEAELEYETNSG
jgi:hypothetical protein